jgi:proton-dependent oligopeptide transporter, POT family
MSDYRTQPLEISSHPPGIPHIISNEAAERFSFYGMDAILIVFMTEYILNRAGQMAVMSDEQAKVWYHLFLAIVYIMPFFGALLADGILGKYRTILMLSLVYCLGHFSLALDHTALGLLFGLGLLAVGAGGIKPSVFAHVGDQFGQRNRHLLGRAFAWVYLGINLSAVISTLLTPWLLQYYGATVAFAVPGLFMLAATVIFWSGRHRFTHIPPHGLGFMRDSFRQSGVKPFTKLALVYFAAVMFWVLFNQAFSAWVLQARHLDLEILGFTLLYAQVQAVNPLFILLWVPLLHYLVYPALQQRMRLTALTKISTGLFLTAIAFALVTAIQVRLDNGVNMSVWWQILAYFILTAGEVMVSITCYEFFYTQAPKRMKTFVMAFYLSSLTLGNLFVSAINHFIQTPDGGSKLTNTQYFAFFTLCMLFTILIFLLLARRYRDENPA